MATTFISADSEYLPVPGFPAQVGWLYMADHVLTAQERLDLYNAGYGAFYAEVEADTPIIVTTAEAPK